MIWASRCKGTDSAMRYPNRCRRQWGLTSVSPAHGPLRRVDHFPGVAVDVPPNRRRGGGTDLYPRVQDQPPQQDVHVGDHAQALSGPLQKVRQRLQCLLGGGEGGLVALGFRRKL